MNGRCKNVDVVCPCVRVRIQWERLMSARDPMLALVAPAAMTAAVR